MKRKVKDKTRSVFKFKINCKNDVIVQYKFTTVSDLYYLNNNSQFLIKIII